MERVVDCPICNDVDRCFEEVQKEYSSFMCFNCGFMSDTRFTEDNQDKIDQDTTILINKLKTFDYQRDIWWFPAVVNMGKLGIIYPDGTEDKKDALPNYKNMLDTENAKTYHKFNFLSACKDMGIAKDI